MTAFVKLYKAGRYPIVLLIAALLPLLTKNNYFLHIANQALLFAIMTLSLNLLTGCTGLFSVGHIAFYGIGAYTSAILTTRFAVPVLLGIVAGGVVAGLFGLVLGVPTLRLRGLYLTISTLAFGEIMYQLFVNWDAVTQGARGIKGIPSPAVFGVALDTYAKFYYLALAFTIVTILLCHNLLRCRTGRAMLAIRENDIAAEGMGINLVKYKIIAFVISSFFAGIAGALYAHEVHYISPESFVSAESTAVLAMMVVGGIGSIPGAVIGGVALTIIPEYLRAFGDIRLVIYGVAIVVIIIFAPKGIGGALLWLERLLTGDAGRGMPGRKGGKGQ